LDGPALSLYFRMTRLSLFLALTGIATAQPATTPLYWPDKNGPTLDNVVPASEAERLPLEWDEAAGKNIVWKTPLEDVGHSSPVIGGDLIWFTAATADGKKQFVYCIERNSGKILHHKLLFENPEPEELGNPINNYAAPSPVLEADAVYIHFGTYGTARLDPLTAEIVWQRRDINVNHYRGPGSSPLIYKDMLILTYDGINEQFVMALDKKTGKTLWKTPRSTDYGDLDAEGKPTRDGDMRKAYHTPTVFVVAGKEQLLSVGSRAAFAYDPATGKELWTIRHGGFNAAPRVLKLDDFLFINTGSERSHMLGVKIDDKMQGDITESHVVWDREKRNASEASPVIVNGILFQITRGGIVTAVEAKTGTDLWEERFQGQHLPSPIAVGDKLYFCSDRGITNVVRAAAKYELLATNKLEGGADAGITAGISPADGAFYIRTKTFLYKVAKK
jgi:outer membrane protein assembly factor BamB